MKDDQAGMAIVFTVVLGGICAMTMLVAFKAAEAINLPAVKSDRELCIERGGQYVELRSGSRCFSKEAFK